MTEPRIATVVSGSGTAVVPYDLVNFTCEISDWAPTGPKAKEKIKEAVAALNGYYDTLRSEDKTKNKRSSMAVNPHTLYRHDSDRDDEPGYRAVYTFEFSTTDVSNVSEIHDRLTSISGVAAKAPQYTFLDPEKHRRTALEQAWTLVQERFEHQCSVLGQNTKEFKLESWSTDFNDRRETFSKVANYADEAVGAAGIPEIDGGVARVKVTLNVTYVHVS